MEKSARYLAAPALALSLGFASTARADTPQSNRNIAQALFDEARDLVAAKRYSEACQKFAESQRLDPGGGTVLNLALCHEKEGKIATAWADFREALGAARRDHRAEREKLAREHLEALEPRLPRLTVRVTSASDERVEVTVDGTAVNASAWDTPFPVDPGDHVLEATAPGKKKWTTKVSLRERELVATVVPVLDSDVGLATTASTTTDAGGRFTKAYVAGGAAFVALGIGTYYGVAAIRERQQADQYCDSNSCSSPDGVTHNDAAIANAWVADAAFGVGLVAAGLSTYWFLSSKGSSLPSASRTSVQLGFAPQRDMGGGVVSCQGSW